MSGFGPGRAGAFALLAIRLYVGVSMFLAGLGKVRSGFTSGEKFASWVERQLAADAPYDFFEPFLEGVVLSWPKLFGSLVAWGELLGGTLLAVGLLTRPAALGMLLLVTSICLASGELFWKAGTAAAFVPMSLALFLSGGRFWGLDGMLKNKLPRWLA